MNATVIAVNHALGAIVVELDDKTCAVLETPDQFIMDIGDQLTAEWLSPDMFPILNTSKENELSARVQKMTQTRNEAIGAISII